VKVRAPESSVPSLSGATLGDGQSKHPRSRLEKSNGKGQGPGQRSTEVPAANRGHRSSRSTQQHRGAQQQPRRPAFPPHRSFDNRILSLGNSETGRSGSAFHLALGFAPKSRSTELRRPTRFLKASHFALRSFSVKGRAGYEIELRPTAGGDKRSPSLPAAELRNCRVYGKCCSFAGVA
jgi:hypothetical protein